MKFRKVLIRILLVLLALVAVVLAVRAVLNFIEGRKLERTLADLKAQGVPLTVKDLIRPCPEGDNGAVLWKAAEELLAFEGQDIKVLTEIYQNLMRETAPSAEAWASISRLIDKNRKALDFIPEIAGKPCFQYGNQTEPLWERKIPNAVKTIRAVRLWGLEALKAADQGDLQGALERLRTGLRFAPLIAQESSLITFLIALADAKAGLLFLNRSLSGRTAGEDLLAPVLADLDEQQILRWKERLRDGIRGERTLFLDMGLPQSATEFARAFGGGAWTERFFYWLIQPLIKRDIRRSLPRYAELETQAGRSYYQTQDFWKPYKDHLKAAPWYAILSKIAIPEMESAFMKVATFDALVRTARAGLACRIFKARTGQYPDSLESLVPGLLEEVPLDPFTGHPLVYRREGAGFLVYSLGSNKKDDGGRSTWEITQIVMDKDDDWTWKELW